VVEGTVYTVQEYVDAQVCMELSATMPATLLQLWRRHRAILPAGSGAHWGAELIARAKRGAELRSATNDKRVLAVLDRALEIAAVADDAIFRTNDVVHGDFHPGNVLARGEEVAAIIDWETAQPGDARADLLRMYAAVATWSDADSAAVSLFRRELEATTPREVWLPIGAEIAVLHLRYGLFAKTKRAGLGFYGKPTFSYRVGDQLDGRSQTGRSVDLLSGTA